MSTTRVVFASTVSMIFREVVHACKEDDVLRTIILIFFCTAFEAKAATRSEAQVITIDVDLPAFCAI